MSHNHTSSVDSTTSSLTSLSSVTSVRDEPFKEQVNNLKTGPIPLSSLVENATNLINKLADNNQKNNYTYGGSTLQLHAVLREMLRHAGDCGGEYGRRYAASAICACAIGDDPDTPQMLHDLAETWLSHLLFICKYTRLTGRTQPNWFSPGEWFSFCPTK